MGRKFNNGSSETTVHPRFDAIWLQFSASTDIRISPVCELSQVLIGRDVQRRVAKFENRKLVLAGGFGLFRTCAFEPIRRVQFALRATFECWRFCFVSRRLPSPPRPRCSEWNSRPWRVVCGRFRTVPSMRGDGEPAATGKRAAVALSPPRTRRQLCPLGPSWVCFQAAMQSCHGDVGQSSPSKGFCRLYTRRWLQWRCRTDNKNQAALRPEETRLPMSLDDAAGTTSEALLQQHAGLDHLLARWPKQFSPTFHLTFDNFIKTTRFRGADYFRT